MLRDCCSKVSFGGIWRDGVLGDRQHSGGPQAESIA
jgi:hypothetical protein